MKKILLFLPVLAVLFADAQKVYTANPNLFRSRNLQDRPVGQQSSVTPVAPRLNGPSNPGPSALSNVLHSQRIGSAGNLLSVIQGACNQIAVNDSLNLVTFIHRNDHTVHGGTVATYRYDISRDRGINWVKDIGNITRDTRINNVDVCGRFPQGVIYNPAGNNVIDSTYLVYAGTWHENNNWSGQLRGRAQLSGDSTTFTNHIDTINRKRVNIATSMCQSQPGVFFNLNTAYSGNFNNGATAIDSALLIEKGVWNSSTREVDWTLTRINIKLATARAGTTTISLGYGYTLAFDPSGQYGWIAYNADTLQDTDLAFSPTFYKTIDGGQTWTGPIQLDLKQIQGVPDRLHKVLADKSGATSGVPSATTSGNLAVDVNGNPHFLTTVGNSNQDEYEIQDAGYTVWDFTYDPNAINGCNWKGILLADINTRDGVRTSDAQPFQEDNRPLISRTADGTKIFFFWTESDAAYIEVTNNDAPNLFGKGIDVVQDKMTKLYNFTKGDTLWNGENSEFTNRGLYKGAVYPTVSPLALINSNVFNVPLVFTQVDYINTNPALLGSSEQPAAFWYVDNINFPATDFSLPLDQVPPTITLNGDDSVALRVHTTYTEAGASAFDCTDGTVTVTTVNVPNTDSVAKYLVLYIATDAAGNSDTATRIVYVGDKPVADFTWSFPSLTHTAKFTDKSLNFPTSWSWTFGDSSGSGQKSPTHQFKNNKTYRVCLNASNNFGKSADSCQEVLITGVGIDEPEFSQFVNMFPNPTTGKVFITFDGAYMPALTVSVYNLVGEKVVQPVNYKSEVQKVELNVSNLASGLYFVKVESEGHIAIKPLSINNK